MAGAAYPHDPSRAGQTLMLRQLRMVSGYDRDPKGPHKVTVWTWIGAAVAVAVVIAFAWSTMG